MPNVQHYDIIRKPLITEKSTILSEDNKYCFQVHMDATKHQVKAAIEAIFSVTVTKVNMLVSNGKVKKTRRSEGKRADTKKAVVTLKDGQTIDLTAGV